MASTKIIVDQLRDIKNINAEEAYERIIAWLTESGGKIDDKRSKKPSFIQATHGSYRIISGWAKNAKKIMKFYLTPMETGVNVRVTIEPTALNLQDVISWSTEAERNWMELLSELWLKVGIYGEGTLEEKSLGLGPQIHVLEKEKLSAMKEFKLGAFGLILLCFGLFLILQAMPELTKISEIWSATIVVFSLLAAPLVLLMLYGALKFLQLRSKIIMQKRRQASF
jgi:hypothetical protein